MRFRFAAFIAIVPCALLVWAAASAPQAQALSFAPHVDFSTGAGANSVAVADLNHDGIPDLAVANGTSAVDIMLGYGHGGFAAATGFGCGTYPDCVAVGDFNGDHKQDLVVADQSGTVSVLLGDGAGGFSAPVACGAGSGPNAVAVGDFNHDGKQDLAVANWGDDKTASTVSVLLGKGDGTFAAKRDFTAGVAPSSVGVADFNGDGRQDLAVADWGAGTVSVLCGDGKGSFGPKTDLATGPGPEYLAVGDFNRDGLEDLAVPDSSSGAVSILRNTTKPTLSSIKPTRGRAGAIVTITGAGFGAHRGAARVYFGGKEATRYVSWSTTRIRVRVPKTGAGLKAVRVKTATGSSRVRHFRVL